MEGFLRDVEVHHSSYFLVEQVDPLWDVEGLLNSNFLVELVDSLKDVGFPYNSSFRVEGLHPRGVECLSSHNLVASHLDIKDKGFNHVARRVVVVAVILLVVRAGHQFPSSTKLAFHIKAQHLLLGQPWEAVLCLRHLQLDQAFHLLPSHRVQPDLPQHPVLLPRLLCHHRLLLLSSFNN